jgi:hypothetical protein
MVIRWESETGIISGPAVAYIYGSGLRKEHE